MLQTQTQNMEYLLLFHCNNVYVNAPQYYATLTRTLSFVIETGCISGRYELRV